MQESGQGKLRRRAVQRYAPAAAALIVGVALSWSAFSLAHRAEYAKVQAQFRANASERLNALRDELRDELQSLESVAALFNASREVSREEFAVFTRGISAQLETVQAVEWVPRVPLADRTEIVENARHEGLEGFEIKELDANGVLRPAAPRSEYFPVYYVEPRAGNEPALGLDLASSPTRRDALHRARDSGRLSVTGRIALVQSGSSDVGFLALIPIHAPGAHADAANRRDALTGFVVGVLRIDRIVHKALSSLAANDMPLRIIDRDASPEERLLYDSGTARSTESMPLELADDVDIGGRIWRIEVRAGPGSVLHGRDWVAWALLASGLLVTAVMTVYLLSSLRRTWQIERTVAARTADLSAVNARLEQEIRSRRSAQLGQQRFFTLSLDMLCIAGFDGYFKELNPAWTTVLGYTLEELKARPFIEFVHPADRDKTMAEAAKIAQGQETTSFENRYRCKDGSYRWLLWSAAVDHQQKRTLAVARDITERKHIEEVKSEFISTVSHELRTPLTSIRGSLGLLRGGVAGVLPDKAGSLVDIAADNCDRLVRLVNDILDIEKIESGQIEINISVLELEEVVLDAIAANATFAAQHGVRLVPPAAAPTIKVLGDRDRIVQVITNLLSNAVRFSPPGASVDVRVERRVPQRVRLSIEDRGPGVPDEFRSRIFEPFVQADTHDSIARGGTGLGLSIAKSIVDRLGGSIGHEPREGGGSRFYFELRSADEYRDRNEAGGAHRPRVLVCEDDPHVAALLQTLLGAHGYAVDVAADAAAALDRARSGRYVAMTLDLILPDGNGIDVIRSLRADPRTAELPIVVVSVRADAARHEINGAGIKVADWLDKPIDDRRLLAQVRRAVDQAGTRTARILHIEDDPDVSRVLATSLGKHCSVVAAPTLAAARRLLSEGSFDLVVLDVQLPDGSGLDLMPELNRQRPPPPVIVFSASEVGKDDAERVAAALVKTRVSQQELVDTIESLLQVELTEPKDKRGAALS